MKIVIPADSQGHQVKKGLGYTLQPEGMMYGHVQVSVLPHNELYLSPCSLTFWHVRNLLKQNFFFFIFPDVAENSGFWFWGFFFF